MDSLKLLELMRKKKLPTDHFNLVDYSNLMLEPLDYFTAEKTRYILNEYNKKLPVIKELLVHFKETDQFFLNEVAATVY